MFIMKKYLSMFFFIAILSIMILSNTENAEASITNIPYPTYSFGLTGELVSTATAYEGTFILNPGFNNPQDIYIDKEDNVYVADTDNKRIYEYNPNTKESSEIGLGILKKPTGVFVDKDLDIYVADASLNEVLCFDKTGVLQKTYEKPDEPLFGEDAPFVPLKVLVDASKNVYVISEGGSNGIIQMDANGDFLGYYGVNKVQLNFALYFKRMLMSADQRAKYASLVPKPATNLAIDKKGLIYTITENEYNTPIKKLNIEGNNILTGRSYPDPMYKDIFVDNNGMIYTVSNNSDSRAVISVHDSTGNLIFSFGSKNPGSLKIGQFDTPVGIAVDNNGDIWVLDQIANNVQVFTKTEFSNEVISAITAYDVGDYDKSKELFNDVVRQNAMFSLAHSNLGNLYAKDGNYKQALDSYKIANDKTGYSDMYWELRDAWIANNLVYLLIIIVGLYIALKIFGIYKNKIKGYQILKNKVAIFKQKPLIKELSLLKRILRDPNDVVYEIKFRQSVRLKTALLLYIIFIFLNIICNYYIKGYLFRGQSTDVVLSFEILKWFLPLILFGIANHLINSLQSGEGFYRDIFIGLIYALSPIFLFKIPIDLLSNLLTYNEAFLYKLAYLIMYAWTVLNVIIVIKEINNYKIGQLIINLLLTLFTMLMMIVLYLVFNVLINQMLTFIQGIIQEVF